MLSVSPFVMIRGSQAFVHFICIFILQSVNKCIVICFGKRGIKAQLLVIKTHQQLYVF